MTTRRGAPQASSWLRHGHPSQPTPPGRPNFVVVMTDDQGAWARGRTIPELITPALDELGRTGREFTNFFCASPVCSPARASMLTGRMPSAHGVHDWLRGDDLGVNTEGVRYLEPFDTFPGLLAGAGYQCAHSGKWHLGDARVPAPGFTRWFSHLLGGGPYYGAPVSDQGELRAEPGYITDAITDHADKFLRELAAGPGPFFLQVNYTAPHTPWGPEHHPARLRDLYADCGFQSFPRDPAHPWFNWGHVELADAMRDPRQALVGFCAALTGVDQGLAQLIATLDEVGVRRETYVVFLSDNGFSCGHHGIWGKGNGTWPLNMWEESIRVPFVVNRPGTVAPGMDDTLTSATELFATLLDLAGVPAPDDPLRSGSSFADRLLVTGSRVPDDPAVVVCDEYGGTRMIRTGRHKYVRRAAGPDELYDLLDDSGEKRSLADDPGHAATLVTLRARLDAWFQPHSQQPYDAFHRPVSGEGQNAPAWSPLDDADRYAPPL